MDRRSKEFLELQKLWYDKLKADGFDDIESDEDHLKVWISYAFRSKHNTILEEAKSEYYRLAGHFLHEYEFKNQVERMIWELHCQGTSYREIAKILTGKDLKVFNKSNKDNVWKVIKRLTKAMAEKWKTSK